MVGDRRHDRRGHDAGGDAGRAQLGDRFDAAQRMRSPRLELPGQLGVEGGDRDRHRYGAVLGELAQEVDVAQDQRVFGDDADRAAGFGQHLEAAAGDLELLLDRLVGLGHPGDGDHLRLEGAGAQPLAQPLRRVGFGEDDAEVEPGREAENSWVGRA